MISFLIIAIILPILLRRIYLEKEFLKVKNHSPKYIKSIGCCCADILRLPSEVLSTPFGMMIRPYLEQYRESIRKFYEPVVNTPPQQSLPSFVPPSPQVQASVNIHPHDRLNLQLVKERKPIVYSVADIPKVVAKLMTFISEKKVSLSPEEQQLLQQFELTNVGPSTYSLLGKKKNYQTSSSKLCLIIFFFREITLYSSS